MVELFDASNEMGDRVEEPVEDDSDGDEESVALALHDGLLVAEVLGGSARLGGLATGAGLVFPVYVHQQEEAEWDYGQERFQQVAGHRDQTFTDAFQAWDR